VDVFAYHLACIDLILRLDEEASAVLQVVDGVCVGIACFECDE
jgi:hypothetical protein